MSSMPFIFVHENCIMVLHRNVHQDGNHAVIKNWNPRGFQKERILSVRKSAMDFMRTIKDKIRGFLGHVVSL